MTCKRTGEPCDHADCTEFGPCLTIPRRAEEPRYYEPDPRGAKIALPCALCGKEERHQTMQAMPKGWKHLDAHHCIDALTARVQEVEGELHTWRVWGDSAASGHEDAPMASTDHEVRLVIAKKLDAYDTLAQRVRDQQREITAWASTVADVEAALAGCPEADTLGERVRRMISGAVDAHLARMDACNRLTAATQRVEMLERQLEAISGEDAFVAAAKAAYTARTGADASTATEDDIDECAEIADAVVRAALAVATPADHLRGATNMIDDHSGDANKVVDAIAGVLLRDYQCRRPGEGEIGNFRPIARMCVDAIKAAPGGHGDGR